MSSEGIDIHIYWLFHVEKQGFDTNTSGSIFLIAPSAYFQTIKFDVGAFAFERSLTNKKQCFVSECESPPRV